MKKSLKVVLVTILIIILMLNTSSFAASDDVMFTASKTDVKTGEEFTVTIAQQCAEGAIGIEAELNYDKNVFELVGNPKMAEGWTNLGEANQIGAMSNDKQTSGEIMTLTFKAKKATTSKIELTKVKLYKTYQNDGVLAISNKSVSINVTGEPLEDDNTKKEVATLEIIKIPNTTEYNEGDKFDPTGIEIRAIYTNQESGVITDYTYSPNGGLTLEDKVITFSYQGKTVTQPITVKAVAKGQKTPVADTDSTTSSAKLPATGAKTKYILIVVAGLIGVGFVSYIGYRKYKEI